MWVRVTPPQTNSRPGEEHWLLNIALEACESTREYSNPPKIAEDALKISGFLPTVQTLATMMVKNWVSPEEILAIREQIHLKYSDRKTADDERLVDWFPNMLISACEANVLEKGLSQKTTPSRKSKVL